MQSRDVKMELLDWALQLVEWKTKADLTFRGVAHPERAEKAVSEWLGIVARGAWAVVGYERQQRGSVHAHLVSSRALDVPAARALWKVIAGFSRIQAIGSQEQAVAYALKHAVKEMDFDVVFPSSVGVDARAPESQDYLATYGALAL